MFLSQEFLEFNSSHAHASAQVNCCKPQVCTYEETQEPQ